MSKPIPLVDAYMARDLITFQPGDDIHLAVKVLLEKSISGAPVVDENGRLVGVLSKKDCFKITFSASYHQDWGGPVSDYMSRDVETIEADTDIVKMAKIFLKSPYRRFPVMSNDRLVGQISRRDVLKALEELW
jgi:predicted transcriptional regulator